MSPVIGKGREGAVWEQGGQGGEQSRAAGDGKCKWKANAYHSHLMDFYIILQK